MNKLHLRNYLEKVAQLRQSMAQPRDGWRYTSVEQYVIENGRWWQNAPLPSTVQRGRKKECFFNAGNLALNSGRLHPKLYRYIEGFAWMPESIPVMHAWCVDRKGKVIDPTWDYHPNTVYFGVCFDADYLLDVISCTGNWGILGPDNPYIPLLRTGTRNVAWESITRP